MKRSTVFGYHDHNFITVLERCSDHLSKPKKKSPPDKKVIKKKALTYKPQKRQLKNTIERIKALDKITTLDQQEKTISDPIKGNKISKGSTLTGKVKESDKASYYDHVFNSNI